MSAHVCLRVSKWKCESWTLTGELQRRIRAMEMRCCPQNTRYLIQRRRYQQGILCKDPAGNQTTRRPPDHRKETQTAVVWTCLPYIRSGQNHYARHSERGKTTRETEKEMGKHQDIDRPGVCQVSEGREEQKKNERN